MARLEMQNEAEAATGSWNVIDRFFLYCTHSSYTSSIKYIAYSLPTAVSYYLLIGWAVMGRNRGNMTEEEEYIG
jgi:hypothetical protein